jgi:hypothetical protein
VEGRRPESSFEALGERDEVAVLYFVRLDYGLVKFKADDLVLEQGDTH